MTPLDLPRHAAEFAGLDLLAAAVVVLDERLRVAYLNSSAEQLLSISRRNIQGHPVQDLFVPDFSARLERAVRESRGFVDQELELPAAPGIRGPLVLHCTVTPQECGSASVSIELHPIHQQLRIEREAQRMAQAAANRELIRNLAHEIKNPLGGLRGSAQLLERELDRAELREYTQVIIQEADRLQALMERLLTPHRPRKLAAVNIHEVCERVRSLTLAEYPRGIRILRSYDVSIPEFQGDREQLIQAVLNIVRNAAQAIQGGAAGIESDAGEIELKTAVASPLALARTRHKLALELQVIDNGPGIPAAIRDRLFYPLVSGRESGSGLGLNLAQTFVQYHGGVIEAESRPGRTCFRVILPLQ